MSAEIDLLLEATADGYVAVEKASHVVWDHDAFQAARTASRFDDEDVLAAPAGADEMSSPYPGCLQLAGACHEYRRVGQTRHFVLFDEAATAHSPLSGGR